MGELVGMGRQSRQGDRPESTQWRFAAALSIAMLMAGCSDGTSSDGTSSGGAGGSVDNASDDGHGRSSIPAGLVGSWYAGAGYTSAPYDPLSGSWGRPNGKGLVYLFEATRTYTKAFQSYESNGGCTTGFTAFESGELLVSGATLITRPSSGHLVYEATCSPELDSAEPLDDLVEETFSWQLRPSEYDPAVTVLLLRSEDGAESTFMPL